MIAKVKKMYPVAAGFAFLAPLVTLAAASTPNPGAIDDRLSAIWDTLNIIIGILFVIATVVFLWGMIMYIANASDEAKREKAKGIMTWGIIGLAVMAVAWGVTNILVSYFGVPTQAPKFVEPPLNVSG